MGDRVQIASAEPRIVRRAETDPPYEIFDGALSCRAVSNDAVDGPPATRSRVIDHPFVVERRSFRKRQKARNVNHVMNASVMEVLQDKTAVFESVGDCEGALGR